MIVTTCIQDALLDVNSTSYRRVVVGPSMNNVTFEQAPIWTVARLKPLPRKQSRRNRVRAQGQGLLSMLGKPFLPPPRSAYPDPSSSRAILRIVNRPALALSHRAPLSAPHCAFRAQIISAWCFCSLASMKAFPSPLQVRPTRVQRGKSPTRLGSSRREPLQLARIQKTFSVQPWPVKGAVK